MTKNRNRWTLTVPVIVALLITMLLPSTGYTASLRDVVINEVAWMGTTVSYNDEWIELYNNTDSVIWNNTGDTAYLRDEQGSLMDSY